MFNNSRLNRNSSMYMGNNKVAIIQAVVEEVSINEEGQVVIEIWDNDGEYYKGVKVCSVGGNTLVWSNFPLRKGQNVTIIKAGEYSHPVCIGSTEKVINEDDLASLTPIIATSADVVNVDEDVVSNYSTDWSIVNNGNQLKVTENNGSVLHSAQQVRIQLMEQAILRISKDGATVDNPLNGQQFIDTLFAYLDVLEAKVNANSAAVASQAPYVAKLGPTVDADAHAAAALGYRGQQPPAEPLALIEDANEAEDRAIAADVEAKGVAANVALSITSAQTKTNAEGNLNQNITIP